MNIIFDNDATVVDYRRFVDKYATPYFKKKYGMNVIYKDKLEIEEIYDCKNVLIKRGYSCDDAERYAKKIVDKFWISFRYAIYSMPWGFFPKAAKTIRMLKRQGHTIEIHTSKMKADEKNIVGKVVRVLMYLQYWCNGCFISCKNFKFYENDYLKANGVIDSAPGLVFEDKPLIIEFLAGNNVNCICVSGKHNKTIKENKNIKILANYSYQEVWDAITGLLGKRKWELYNEMALSDCFYNKLLRFRFVIRWKYSPVVLNKERLKKIDNTGCIYASNHRSTLDPIIITAIINEPIHYAALKRFFDAEDSIFNNNKNPWLCRITAKLFRKLRFFPIERSQDNVSNIRTLRDMVNYSNMNGKIGIFPEGTTLKSQENDFGEFKDSFVKLAVATNAMIQPISILWCGNRKKRPIVNFGNIISTKQHSVNEIMEMFIKCQKSLLEENREIAKQII